MHHLIAGLPPEPFEGLAKFSRAHVEEQEFGCKRHVVCEVKDFCEEELRVAAWRTADRLQKHVKAHDVVGEIEKKEERGEKQQHLGQFHLCSRVQAAGQRARSVLPVYPSSGHSLSSNCLPSTSPSHLHHRATCTSAPDASSKRRGQR
jgi:hypothetical protein